MKASERIAKNIAIEYAGISGDREAAIDPATVLVFIQLVMEIVNRIKECKKTPKDGAEMMQSPGLFQKMMLRKIVKDDMGRQDFRAKGENVIAAILKHGRNINEQEVLELYQED